MTCYSITFPLRWDAAYPINLDISGLKRDGIGQVSVWAVSCQTREYSVKT